MSGPARSPIGPARSRSPTATSSRRGASSSPACRRCVRVLLDQHRADARAGLRTATLVSGYQGSPLAGLDQELERLGHARRGARHRAAPRGQRGARRDRRVGLAARRHAPRPALRRRRRRLVRQGARASTAPSDAIRHGNHRRHRSPRRRARAVRRRSGVQVLDDPERVRVAARGAAGPDPRARAACRRSLDLGRHAIACSRASGLWSALKVVTNVADAAGTAEVGLGPRDARSCRCSNGRARRTCTARRRSCCRRTRSRWSARWSRCASSSRKRYAQLNALNRDRPRRPGRARSGSSPPA